MKKSVLTILALAIPALAQNSVKEALVKHWKTSADFTIAVAKAMPADSYNFRPNPDEMSFGHVIAHIGAANMLACSMATGAERPVTPPKLAALLRDEKSDVDRETALAYMTDAFDFCNKVIPTVTAEKLDAVVGPSETRKMTGYEWLWSYFTHTAHHRGQAEVYLRVKGIKPPDYKF
jgi:uncharacterized damage-inducible protein DinB